MDIIEPCGYLFTDRALKRAGMDYLDKAEVRRHPSWSAFLVEHRARGGRLVLLTSKGTLSYTQYDYSNGDTLLLGRESAGVPAKVHGAADACLLVPLRSGLRSLDVAQAGAMVLGEALRQTKGFQ